MRVLIAVILSFCIVPFIFAKTPDELAVEYYDNLIEGNWDVLSGFYTDESLEEFRDLFGFILDIPGDDDRDEVITMLFGKDATVKKVKKMSDKKFFSGLMKGIYDLIGKYALMNYDSVEVIGSVVETEELTHVVSRCMIEIDIHEENDIDFSPMNLEVLEVLSFEKVKGKWKLLLDSKIRGLAQQISTVME